MQSYEVYSKGDLFRSSINEVTKRLMSVAEVDVVFVGVGTVSVKLAAKAIDSGVA